MRRSKRQRERHRVCVIGISRAVARSAHMIIFRSRTAFVVLARSTLLGTKPPAAAKPPATYIHTRSWSGARQLLTSLQELSRQMHGFLRAQCDTSPQPWYPLAKAPIEPTPYLEPPEPTRARQRGARNRLWRDRLRRGHALVVLGGQWRKLLRRWCLLNLHAPLGFAEDLAGDE